MNISLIHTVKKRLSNACLVLGVNETGKLTDGGQQFDRDSKGYLTRVIKQGDIKGSVGSSLLLRDVAGIPVDRILLVGTGKATDLNDDKFRKICTTAAKQIRTTGSVRAVSLLHEIATPGRDFPWKCRQEALSVLQTGYQFTLHKKSSASAGDDKLDNWLVYNSSKKDASSATEQLRLAAGINAGNDLAKDLGNLAPNICTPAYLAKTAKALQKKSGKLKVSVLEEAQMKKLSMGALLSVSQGSREPAKLICMHYQGAAKSVAPLVLIGKGITFDTGGISIKPSATMDEMKYDMCGAASVIGVMKACVELALECNLICVVAAAENMPDGAASRPGDVVTTMSGQTVEILNTDAEGRLVLCDALTWVKKFKPAAVIDVATLTGACIVALGNSTSALMANDQTLAEKLLEASTISGDKAWQLPLWDEYQSLLDSNFADMANIGGRAAGSITAGCFLARFAEDYPWAHLDIAGVAWKSGAAKGATGRPVPLLMQYLYDHHVKH